MTPPRHTMIHRLTITNNATNVTLKACTAIGNHLNFPKHQHPLSHSHRCHVWALNKIPFLSEEEEEEEIKDNKEEEEVEPDYGSNADEEQIGDKVEAVGTQTLLEGSMDVTCLMDTLGLIIDL